MPELRTKSEPFEKKLFDSQRFSHSAMRVINSFLDQKYCTDQEILEKLKSGRGNMPIGRLRNYLAKLESLKFFNSYNLITHDHPPCHKQAHILVDVTNMDKKLKTPNFFTSRKFIMKCSKCQKLIFPNDDKYLVGSENKWSLSEKGLLSVLAMTKNPSLLYEQYLENMLVKICYFLIKNKMKNQVLMLQEILQEDILLDRKSSKQNSWIRNSIKIIKNTKTTDSKSLEIQKILPITI